MLEKGQPFIVLPCGKDGRPLRRTMVQREDVIDALLRMIGEPKAIGEIFHVSGPAFDYDQPCRYLAERLPLPTERVLLDAHGFEIDCSHTTDLLGWTAEIRHHRDAGCGPGLARERRPLTVVALTVVATLTPQYILRRLQ